MRGTQNVGLVVALLVWAGGCSSTTVAPRDGLGGGAAAPPGTPTGGSAATVGGTTAGGAVAGGTGGVPVSEGGVAEGGGGSGAAGGEVAESGGSSGDAGAAGEGGGAAGGPGPTGGTGGSGGARDTTPPDVESVSPRESATAVSLDEEVTVIFTEPIDSASLSAQTLRVRAGSAPVDGELLASDRTLRFVPAQPLALGTTYTVSLSTEITDLAGNPLASPVEWTFGTRQGVWGSAQSIADIVSAFSGTYGPPPLGASGRGGWAGHGRLG